MRKTVFALAVTAGAIGLLGFQANARASVIDDDPLHGYCGGAGQCADNGTNSPTTNNPPVNFGFTISPAASGTGDFRISFLVPNNSDPKPANLSFHLTGTLVGTATLFNPTAWASGDLSAFLGLGGASPANKIDAYLPATKTLDLGATGYYVYQVDFGTQTILGPSSPNTNPLENITESLPVGSYIVGDLDRKTCTTSHHVITCSTSWIATANSGAIFITSKDPPPSAPEPASLTILGAGLVGLGVLRVRRQKR